MYGKVTFVKNGSLYERCAAAGGPGPHKDRRPARQTARAFTIVEIMIVVVILGFIAMAAIPMMSSASSVQIKTAANLIAADLEYAKSMAISRGNSYTVVFDKWNETYQIEDSSGNIIPHPVHKGTNYVVDFTADHRLDKVNISAVNFDPGSTQTVTFDSLGSPYSGTTTANDLNVGTVTLTVDGRTITVNVEPVTGYITIN